MSFSNAGLQAVATFAAQLGVPARPAKDGSFAFQFARAGRFSLTPFRSSGRVVVSLARGVSAADPAHLARILGVAGHDVGTNRLVHAALTADGEAHLAVTMDEGEVDVGVLYAALEQLTALHDRAA